MKLNCQVSPELDAPPDNQKMLDSAAPAAAARGAALAPAHSPPTMCSSTGSNDSIVLLVELKTYIFPANAAAVAPGIRAQRVGGKSRPGAVAGLYA